MVISVKSKNGGLEGSHSEWLSSGIVYHNIYIILWNSPDFILSKKERVVGVVNLYFPFTRMGGGGIVRGRVSPHPSPKCPTLFLPLRPLRTPMRQTL